MLLKHPDNFLGVGRVADCCCGNGPDAGGVIGVAQHLEVVERMNDGHHVRLLHAAVLIDLLTQAGGFFTFFNNPIGFNAGYLIDNKPDGVGANIDNADASGIFHVRKQLLFWQSKK
ncbi:hypothetical protein D3C71_1815240 [compost metagenome]